MLWSHATTSCRNIAQAYNRAYYLTNTYLSLLLSALRGLAITLADPSDLGEVEQDILFLFLFCGNTAGSKLINLNEMSSF